MKQVTFIHAADLHLDSPMVGLRHLPEPIFKRIRESTFIALKTITKAAIEKQVDFVILAGDLFDGEDRSLRAQSRLRAEMLKLEAAGIPVYAVHGNHDHLGGTWVELDMPSNVHIFERNVEIKTLHTKGGASVHLYGFSYPERHVFDRKIDQYTKQEGSDFHIGILHGNEGGKQEHGNYAPFYLKDLTEKQFDYWALGHIHKRMTLSESPAVVYPGNIQGRNKKETGVKGCYYVTLTEQDAILEFLESSDVIWDETVIDGKLAPSFQDLLQLCHEKMCQQRRSNKGILLSMEIINVQFENEREKSALELELLELLQEEESDEESFVWVYEINYSERFTIDKEGLKSELEFFNELFETAEQFEDIKSSLSALYGHQLGRKYLSSLSEKDQQLLLEEAENLLVKLLYQT